jgi:hypothetical protein
VILQLEVADNRAVRLGKRIKLIMDPLCLKVITELLCLCKRVALMMDSFRICRFFRNWICRSLDRAIFSVLSLISLWFSKFGVIENANLFKVQVAGHAPSIAYPRNGALDNNAIITMQNTSYLI